MKWIFLNVGHQLHRQWGKRFHRENEKLKRHGCELLSLPSGSTIYVIMAAVLLDTQGSLRPSSSNLSFPEKPKVRSVQGHCRRHLLFPLPSVFKLYLNSPHSFFREFSLSHWVPPMCLLSQVPALPLQRLRGPGLGVVGGASSFTGQSCVRLQMLSAHTSREESEPRTPALHRNPAHLIPSATQHTCSPSQPGTPGHSPFALRLFLLVLPPGPTEPSILVSIGFQEISPASCPFWELPVSLQEIPLCLHQAESVSEVCNQRTPCGTSPNGHR